MAANLLVRKMNETEARIFAAHGEDIDALRPKGLLNDEAFPVERSVAFSIDGISKFGDAEEKRMRGPTRTHSSSS